MTLAELITALEAADPNRVVPHGFTNPHSYRGDYMDLAFEPASDVTVADMLADARNALGTTYEGYKGGDFTMGEHTWCWLSQEGDASGETVSALLLQLMLAEPPPAGAADEAKPEVIVSITRYTVSVLTADNINHRYFALSVELTPRGWIVTDGHSGYDADGTAHHGEARWHPFADYDDALAVARRLAPGLTVNGRTATEVLQRTRETAPEATTAPLGASQPSEAPVEGETGGRAATGRLGDSGGEAARIALTRNQLAALLAHHADVIAARWRAVAPGAGAWEIAAALSLTSHANELSAEMERPAVTELLDNIWTFPLEQQAAAAEEAAR